MIKWLKKLDETMEVIVLSFGVFVVIPCCIGFILYVICEFIP